MNWTELIVIAVILLLFAGACLYIRRNGTCTENCETCHGFCSKKKKNAHQKSLVERYYEDHPRPEHSSGSERK